MNKTHVLHILGLAITGISRKAIFLQCEEWLHAHGSHQIVTVNPEFVVEAQRNSRFRECINAADISLIDGFGLLFALKMRYPKYALERLTGVEYVLEIARIAERTEKSLYLVGGGPNIARRAADALVKRYPLLRIVGAEEGMPLDCKEDEWQEKNQALVARICAAQPDILLVAFGAPKQDVWIQTHLPRFSSVKIAIGVGGTFDYLAGRVRYAPQWIRHCGFEWLFRLCTQRGRGRRIFTAVVIFPFLAVKDYIASYNAGR